MLDKFQGHRTPPPENVGSDRRSPTAGPSDIARLNPLAKVADSAPQGPDVAPGPSMATHVPPASGPSHHDAPSSGDFAPASVVEGDWEPVRAWSHRFSSPERLRDELELIQTKISELREIIDFMRARGRSPPDHYYRDLDILHAEYDPLTQALVQSREAFASSRRERSPGVAPPAVQNEVAPALPQRPVGFPGRPVSGLLVPSLLRGSSLVGSSGTATGVDSHRSVLASEGMVPGPSGTVVRRSHHTVRSKRSTKTAPLPPLPSKSSYASADCMATIKRFARQAGFSSTVAGQLVFCRRQSTCLNYQARWGTYRKWCRDFGHRSSSLSIAKIADFLTSLFKRKGAALSTIKGYRAMLSAVFKFPLPEISTSPILKDLIRSFEISARRPLFPPPPWDLDKVLQFLPGPPFEPPARASFLDKTKKALFLLAMATAKRVSELQALSFSVSFQGEDLVLYYDPFFHAKTESAANPLPRSVIVPSLSDFAGDLPERVQCPVRAIRFLRKAARSASYIPSRLFVSPRNPERAMSKNAMSFYLRQLIIDSGAVSTSRPPRAHDIRGIATSLSYYSNLSLSNLMQVATWKSNRVFASRYLKEVSATQDNIRQFGPLVIAGDRLHTRPPQHRH